VRSDGLFDFSRVFPYELLIDFFLPLDVFLLSSPVSFEDLSQPVRFVSYGLFLESPALSPPFPLVVFLRLTENDLLATRLFFPLWKRFPPAVSLFLDHSFFLLPEPSSLSVWFSAS